MGSYSDFRQREAKSNDTPKKSRAQRAITESPAIAPRYVKPSARGTLEQAENITRTSSSPAEVERKVARARRTRSQALRRKKRTILRSVEKSRQKRSQRVKTSKPKAYKAPKVKRPAPRKERAATAGTALAKSTVPKRPVSEAQALSKIPKPTAKPKKFAGKKTAGTPTYAELKKARDAGKLKRNKKGYVTTPRVRKAARKLKRAKQAVKKSGPSLAGLSPQEAEVVKYARKAHRKYPDVPASLLMSLMRQESGFQADAKSSAAAQGLTQFIPSTAASYGVKYGTGKKEKQSQVTGAAAKLSNDGFATDPKGALTAYTGGYSDAEYNNPVLQGAADYKALDKPGSPKAVKKLKKAKAEAKAVGLKAAEKKGDSYSYPAKKAKKLKGAWAGSREAVMEVVKGLPWGSGKRTPAENAAVGGAAESDHLTTKKNAFAADLGPGTDVAETVAKRLKLEGWAPGTYERFTSPKYPGYSFQLLWEVEGHYDHVHIGAEWTGEDLPAGTYSGGAGLGGSTGAVSGSTVSAYASATGQSVKSVQAKLKRKKLTPRQILRKLEKLGVGVGEISPGTEASSSDSKGTTLAELEKKYLAA